MGLIVTLSISMSGTQHNGNTFFSVMMIVTMLRVVKKENNIQHKWQHFLLKSMPSFVRPRVVRPSVVRPSVARPSVAWPSVARPSVARPSVARPSVIMLGLAAPLHINICK